MRAALSIAGCCILSALNNLATLREAVCGPLNQSVVLMPVDFRIDQRLGLKRFSMLQVSSSNFCTFHLRMNENWRCRKQSNCSYLFFKTRLDCIWILCSFFFFSFSWKDWLLIKTLEFQGRLLHIFSHAVASVCQKQSQIELAISYFMQFGFFSLLLLLQALGCSCWS